MLEAQIKLKELDSKIEKVDEQFDTIMTFQGNQYQTTNRILHVAVPVTVAGTAAGGTYVLANSSGSDQQAVAA